MINAYTDTEIFYNTLPYLILIAFECLALLGMTIGFILEGGLNDKIGSSRK